MTARKILFRAAMAFCAFVFMALIFINCLIYAVSAPYIAPKNDDAPDYILVLGAGLNDDGSPGRMLRDRLNTAVTLYEAHQNEENPPKIIVSGDRSIGSGKSYDEVSAMRDYLLQKGIPVSSIIEDPLGFSTAESIDYLATLERDARIAIVTQEYHLYRAVFIAYMNGHSISGYVAPPCNDSLQFYRDMREIVARAKDFFLCVFSA